MLLRRRTAREDYEDRGAGPFRHSEFHRVAVIIGLTSVLIGLLTFGYDDAVGLPSPPVWAVGQIVAGLAAIGSMRYRVKGYATAGALVAGLAIMRGLALAGLILDRGKIDATAFRNGVGVILWFSFAGSSWWIWSRVLARHVAWNRLVDHG